MLFTSIFVEPMFEILGERKRIQSVKCDNIHTHSVLMRVTACLHTETHQIYYHRTFATLMLARKSSLK